MATYVHGSRGTSINRTLAGIYEVSSLHLTISMEPTQDALGPSDRWDHELGPGVQLGQGGRLGRSDDMGK